MTAHIHRVVAGYAQSLAVLTILSATFAQPAPSAVLFSSLLSGFAIGSLEYTK